MLAENAEWLDSQMVTHVLSLGGDEMLAQLKAVPARVEAGTLTHSAVKISDKSTGKSWYSSRRLRAFH